jgi:hypothetical protein
VSLLLKDRVQETATTTGTGAFTLAGAVAGFVTFASVCSVSDTFYYAIEGVDGSGVPTGEFETGLGTYSGTNTLTRTTVLSSSNAGSLVSFSAGTKRVMLTAAAVYLSKTSKRTVFAASGTWTKDARANSVFVQDYGAGASGGSGPSIASGTASGGGGGGGGGSYAEMTMDAATLGATETVTIGAGGASVAGVTGGAAGNNGNAGGNSTFGSWLTGYGGGRGGGGGSAAIGGGGGGAGLGGAGWQRDH